DKFPTNRRSAEIDTSALDQWIIVLRLVEVADNVGQQAQHTTGTLEFRDRAPALIQHRDQLGMKRIRLYDVIPVRRLPAGRGHVLTQLAVHVPIRFSGGTMICLVAQLFKQPTTDDLV